MKKFSPLVKGLITGSAMIVTSFFVASSEAAQDSPFRYLIFALYFAGILWTLIDYSRTSRYTGTLGDLFGQGFRCFVIVTLMVTTFTGIMSLTHPQLAEERAALYRKDLEKETSKTPTEKEELIKQVKDNFATSNMYIAVFSHMIMGAVFTLAAGTFVVMRKKK